MSLNRLKTGGRIDRGAPLTFHFNGTRFKGYAGDTLASALIANGVSVVGRSFKLHRPRGIVGSGAEEPNAILQIGTGRATLPNQRATQVELYDGLEARSVKGWPSINFDIVEINDVFSRLFGAGFYYKTFMRPKALWPTIERFIRRAAGLGESPTETDPDYYEHRNVHCDVLIAGAGPAGLMAALAAARTGARVVIADDQNEFGGALLSANDEIDGQAAVDWVRDVRDELASCASVTLLPRSTVFGYFDHNFLTIAQRCSDHLGEHQHRQPRQRMWRVRAKQVVLAQGAFERPLVFCNNDRPGVMTASAVSSYIKRYAVTPGRRAVVFTNNDSAYQTAIDLERAGVTVAAIIDSRAAGAADLGAAAESLGLTIMRGHVVCDVLGRRRVSGVRIARFNGDSSATVEDAMEIDCDLVAMSGGWSPAVHLHSQAGGKNQWDDDLHCFVPGKTHQACRSAGAADGLWSLQECLRSGLAAGNDAAQGCGFASADVSVPAARFAATNAMVPL